MNKNQTQIYQKFEEINGNHPLRKSLIDGYIDYAARLREGARVVYFNFNLARDIGLIPKDHPNKLTKNLEKKIIETFGIIIINEFDIENNKEYPKETIKDHKYMATRYLQLQHQSKTGKTSGDGRSIWNGQITNEEGITFDISSCGTGATALSPATSKFGKFFESGDPSISYGCGYSEIDEGLETLIFSEVINSYHMPTERALLILGYEKNFAINVRVHENLLRPSHFFLHLKQKNHLVLKKLFDYYGKRQKNNNHWPNWPKDLKDQYRYFLEKMAITFSNLASTLEDKYIFCWLEWDGDNILMDGGILDYGSIRQFGLFHAEYRYDDIERFSTNIKEQKERAKYTVMTFAQMIDFLETNEKKNIKEFENHWSLILFEENFELQKDKNLLRKIGLDERYVNQIINFKRNLIEDFRKDFTYFERKQSNSGIKKLPDGITTDAVFCMRDILRELPQLYLNDIDLIEDEDFINIMKSNYATAEDLYINHYRKNKIKSFQKHYKKLIKFIALENQLDIKDVLLGISLKSNSINRVEKVTGDSICHIVSLIQTQEPPLNSEELHELVENFSRFQEDSPFSKVKEKMDTRQFNLVRECLEIVRNNREGL